MYHPTSARRRGIDAVRPVGPGLFGAGGALAAFSMSLLGIALLAPEQLGAGLAAIGLAGLFLFRLFAMFAGWAPRGAAWTVTRPTAVARE